ncbi:hypothetical protein, partial [Saccharospirillum sp.]|uniref:hypothetical protein n=1 Tax=Saccharospirillum sp. TaxID=2033801 RepID=UPI0034A084FE
LELQMKIWAPVKVALICISSVSAVYDTSYAEVGPKIGWAPVVTGLVFFPALILIGLFVLKTIFRRKLNFEKPSLESNPLDFSHPEHFFHLAGIVILMSGVSDLVAAYVRSGEVWPVQIAPVSLGIGVLFGLWILQVVHAGQLASSNN